MNKRCHMQQYGDDRFPNRNVVFTMKLSSQPGKHARARPLPLDPTAIERPELTTCRC